MFIIFAGMMYWGVVLTEQRFRALIAKYQAEQQLAEHAVAAMKRAIESVAGPMIEVGQEIRKHEPRPGTLASSMRPRVARVMCFTIASPRPVPPASRDRARSTR